MKNPWIILALALPLAVTPAAEPRFPKIPRTHAAAGPGAARLLRREAVSMLTGLPSGWSALANISKNTTDSEVAIGAVDAKSNAYCAWTEWYGAVGARRDIVFTTNKTGSWATPYSWSLEYPDIDDVGFPALAVTPDGNAAVVAYHDGDMSLGLMTVRVKELVNGTWSAVKNLSGTSDASSYVTLATNPVDSAIYAAWMADLGEFTLRYKYRDAATGQWSAAALVNGGTAGGQYLPNIYVDGNGTAHLVYIVRNGDASVWYTKNANPKSASGWTAPVQISADSGLAWTYPKVAADGDGNAYVVWQQLDKGASAIMLRYQTNGTWGTAQNISNLADLSETASIAVNPTTKEMFVVWQTAFGYTTGNVNWDICLKTYEIDKATGQKAWSDIYRITSYPGHAGEPQIKGTKEGDLHLFFFDNPVGDYAAEIFYAVKMAPRLYAVASPTVASSFNKVLFGEEKWNTVAFSKNPDNDDTKIQEYRVYRKKSTEADTAFAVVATLNTSTFQYIDKKLPPGQKYAYLISVVNKDGLELKSAVTIEP
jgi:hypothetical protein